MNKKILGIRVGTILTALGCIAAAIILWVLAKYNLSFANESAALTLPHLFFRG
jgi:uncharacterized membrane protein YdjX (TVP38/TMEM64 family)